MFYPSFEELNELSARYNVLPVCMRFHADLETPISIFEKLDRGGDCFLLESVEGGEVWGRYSFIGRNPLLIMKTIDRHVRVEHRDGITEILDGHPFKAVESVLGRFKAPKLEDMPRFIGGAVGYFGYDTVRLNENLGAPPHDDLGLPDCQLHLVDELVVYDHLKQNVIIIVDIIKTDDTENAGFDLSMANDDTENAGFDLSAAYGDAAKRLLSIYEEIQCKEHAVNGYSRKYSSDSRISAIRKEPNCSDDRLLSNTSMDAYYGNVRKALEYIRNGDIFQVVLSMRFCLDTDCEPLLVYRMLRTLNPSPYMYYLRFKGFSIVGSSPEMLVRVEDGNIETRPIAGTRPRGRSHKEDEILAKELLADTKETAEHSMLVDLARNDAGKICDYGTVKLENVMSIEKYSHVMHIVTGVKGRLRNDKGAFDALISILPAGTLSGAPKIRAMEIIDELEKTKRGPYGGAICYFDFSGNLDSCITIRTLVFKDGKAYVQAGAGIVADSVPEREYTECMNKAGALIRAVREAEAVKGAEAVNEPAKELHTTKGLETVKGLETAREAEKTNDSVNR